MIGLKSSTIINLQKVDQEKKIIGSEEKLKKDLINFPTSSKLNKLESNFSSPNINNKGVTNFIKNNFNYAVNEDNNLNRDRNKNNNLPFLSNVGNSIIGGIENQSGILAYNKKQEQTKFQKLNQNTKLIPYLMMDKLVNFTKIDKQDLVDKQDKLYSGNLSPFKQLPSKRSNKNIRNMMFNINNISDVSNGNHFKGSSNHNRQDLNPAPSTSRSSLEIFQENLYQKNNKISKNINDLSMMNPPRSLSNINHLSVINHITDSQKILPTQIIKEKVSEQESDLEKQEKPKWHEKHNLSVNNSSQNLILPTLNELTVEQESLILNLTLLELWIDIENVNLFF